VCQSFPPRPPTPGYTCRVPITCLAVREGTLVAGYSSGHVRLFRLSETGEEWGEGGRASQTPPLPPLPLPAPTACPLPGGHLEVEITAHARPVMAVDWHPGQHTVRGEGGPALTMRRRRART
jgi:hypothetical protein